MGERSPSDLRSVQTTLGSAAQLISGNRVGSRDAGIPTVLISATGHFVDDAADRPRGQPAPTGTSLVLLFDAQTGQLLGISISGVPPDLSALGTPAPLG